MTIDFAQDELGSMLRDSVARYAEEQYGFSSREHLLAGGEGYAPRVWADAAEQGWLAIRHPEAMDGAAGDVASVGALMELVGRHLLMEPWLVSAGLGAGLIAASEDEDFKTQWLPKMAAAAHTVGVAWHIPLSRPLQLEQDRVSGGVVAALHGNIADAVLLPARDPDGTLAIVTVALDQAPVVRADRVLIDGRHVADLHFKGASCVRLAFRDAAQAWQRVRTEALALLCAEGAGVADRLVELTLDYVRVRKQFGYPIGRNQALQHRLVEMRLQVEEAQAMAAAALERLRAGDGNAYRTTAGAAAVLFDALQHVADEAVQMHGGIGITEEAEVSHYYRRANVVRALLGPRAQRLAEFCQEGASDEQE